MIRGKNEGKQRHEYKLQQQKKSGKFYNLNDIGEHINFVKLMDTVENVNHGVSISRFLI